MQKLNAKQSFGNYCEAKNKISCVSGQLPDNHNLLYWYLINQFKLWQDNEYLGTELHFRLKWSVHACMWPIIFLKGFWCYHEFQEGGDS
jgi:hypothetical protein